MQLQMLGLWQSASLTHPARLEKPSFYKRLLLTPKAKLSSLMRGCHAVAASCSATPSKPRKGNPILHWAPHCVEVGNHLPSKTSQQSCGAVKQLPRSPEAEPTACSMTVTRCPAARLGAGPTQTPPLPFLTLQQAHPLLLLLLLPWLPGSGWDGATPPRTRAGCTAHAHRQRQGRSARPRGD
eukprot:1159166-Pelagomonas_calceolata.AAC.7